MSVAFRFQCAYCETTEFAFGSFRSFTVDHFRPKSKRRFHALINDWTNLYYFCADCNSFKNDFWPSAKEAAAGFVLADPCEVDPFAADIQRESDGVPHALTKRGQCMIEVFAFDLRSELHQRWKLQFDLASDVAETEVALEKAKNVLGAEDDRKALENRLRRDLEFYRKYFLGWDTRPKAKH